MESKVFTIHDDGTEIRVLAVKLTHASENEGRVITLEGYDKNHEYVMLTRLSGDSIATYQPDRQPDATMQAAHRMLLDYFDTIPSGGKVNVKEYRETEKR